MTARDRFTLWMRVLDHALVPPPEELAATLAERAACGAALWAGPFATELGPEFPSLFVVPEPALAGEIRRVASAAHGVATALHALHCDRDDGATAGETGMWLTLAAAGLDHLVDDGIFDANAMRQHVAPGRVLEVLRGGEPIRISGQPWVERALGFGLAKLAAQLRAGDGPYHRELCGELEQCIQAMLVAQLRSDELMLSPHADLARVRTDLRAINALTVWVGAYAGLFGHAALPFERLELVRRVATLVGDVGWALDALSDIHTDLAHGVFSLVWLELAEHTGLAAPWLIDPVGNPALALATLHASPVIDRLLARLEHQLEEIDRQSEHGTIARLSRYMVAAFLYEDAP
jgi:hypothetical protein